MRFNAYSEHLLRLIERMDRRGWVFEDRHIGQTYTMYRFKNFDTGTTMAFDSQKAIELFLSKLAYQDRMRNAGIKVMARRKGVSE